MARRKSSQGVLLMASDIELAYAAGIIDGEGSITISRINSPRYKHGFAHIMEVKVGMIDAGTPNFLKLLFGGSVRLYIKPKDRPQFVWTVSSKRAMLTLKALLPYLRLKKSQAQTAIEFQKLRAKPGTYSPRHPKPLVLLQAEGVLRQQIRQLNHGKGRGKIGTL